MTRPCFITWCRWNQPTAPDGNLLILEHDEVLATHKGATLAAIALQNWDSLQTIADVIASAFQVTFRDSLAAALACLGQGQQATTYDLLPTDRWWAPTKDLALQGVLSNPDEYVNPLLPALNLGGLDPNVRYTVIFASASGNIAPTPTLSWGDPPGSLSPLTDAASYAAGDGLVPLRSQLAADTGWPSGTQPGQITVFGNAGAIFHTDYFKNPSPAIPWIHLILWP